MDEWTIGHQAACDQVLAKIDDLFAKANGPHSRPRDDASDAYNMALSNIRGAVRVMRDQTVAMGERGAFGFRAGAEAMREAAAKHIEGGRAVLDIRVTKELLRDGEPLAVLRLITDDAEAATRARIVQVIRDLPLPSPY